MEGTVVGEGNVVVVDVGVAQKDAGDGFSTLRCPSGTRDLLGVTATVDTATQEVHLEVNVVAAVAAAAAVVAATATARRGENVGDECAEPPENKIHAPR